MFAWFGVCQAFGVWCLVFGVRCLGFGVYNLGEAAPLLCAQPSEVMSLEPDQEQKLERGLVAFKNNYFTEMCSGSVKGSYVRLMDYRITQV